ncbi:MAG: zinc metallopeptidase [Oscillospiraceae bacterium]|jgi:Zn-dependent membrane protease YugP|nr:zinc metallopeptidase [Oscillospiraceae bacterium]
MYFYGFDEYFLIFVIPAMLFSLAMQIMLRSAYKQGSQRRNARGMTGAQAAERVLRKYGITDVQIEPVRGKLTDHYDPKAKVIRLSEGVYNSPTVAAVGIAAHEAGHAAQHAQDYRPIRVRNAILPACNIGSTAALPLILFGFMLNFDPLVTVGLALFSLVVLFQLVTLPVEFNASRRALRVIDEAELLSGEDYRGARRVLRAAAMTYVAALVISIANLLRLLLRFSRRR